MLMEQQERKLSGPKQTDGSKLSFAEKMKLFAQEAWTNIFDISVCKLCIFRLVKRPQGIKQKSLKLKEKLMIDSLAAAKNFIKSYIKVQWIFLVRQRHFKYHFTPWSILMHFIQIMFSILLIFICIYLLLFCQNQLTNDKLCIYTIFCSSRESQIYTRDSSAPV